MKHATEIIELMGAFPGREWRMVQIVRYVSQGRTLDLKQRKTMRRGIQRAIEALIENGSIATKPPGATRGAPVFYVWKSAT